MKSESNASDLPLLPDRVIARIWTRMRQVFGDKWSVFGVSTLEDGRLSETAKTWQKGLAGVSVDQAARGIAAVIAANDDWPPSLVRFRRLCVGAADAPSLAEVVGILANSGSVGGCLADRFRHPLVLAIAQSPGVDLFSVRRSSSADAMRIVKPVFEQFLASGWPAWPGHAFERQAAIVHDAPVQDKALGFEYLARLKALTV